MIWLLAQVESEEIAGQWFMWVSIIMLIGAIVVVIPVLAGVARRWKQRQLKAIDQDRAARRAGQSADRVDAWQASSERYVDHDKLTEEDELFSRDEEDEDEEPDDDDDLGPSANPGAMGSHDEDEDRDPFGLFSDKPYQETDDEDEDEDFDDDEDFDENEDWDEEDEDEEEDQTR